MKIDKKYTLIVGLGKTGRAVANFLNANGDQLVITDIDDSKKDQADFFQEQGIKTEIGFHNTDTFENADRIIVSPGIPLTIPELKNAKAKNIPVIGELDIISELIDIPIVAVTGTNGKTTVTTLIGDMLRQSGFNVFVCGNIGTPIVDYLSTDEKADIIVAEISSFQLDTSNKFKPDVAVLLNVAEDHLDRYDDFEDYSASKWSIFKNQTDAQFSVVNPKIENAGHKTPYINSKVLYYSDDSAISDSENAFINSNSISISDSVIDLSITKLKGEHNKENIAAACLATLAVRGNMEGILKGLKNFIPLPHRLEFVQSTQGIDWYNDSKATNPDAVARAVECFDQDIILIMGGLDKDTDFLFLQKSFKKKIKKLIIMGDAKEKLLRTFADICEIIIAESMEDAVKKSYQNAEKGDVVLLSPGCASFDMYESYSKRGFDFIKQIKKLGNNLNGRTE